MKALPFLQSMKHSPVGNYGGIPGLTSWLIGAPGPHGLVRLMESARAHQEPIIPHSHRFNFHCVVLAGEVQNILWTRVHNPSQGAGDLFMETTLEYSGKPGKYARLDGLDGMWRADSNTYMAGQEYSMQADEVHSIFFSRGAVVLFFEGPAVSDTSVILEPIVDGELVPTFKVEPWMFKRPTGSSGSAA